MKWHSPITMKELIVFKLRSKEEYAAAIWSTQVLQVERIHKVETRILPSLQELLYRN